MLIDELDEVVADLEEYASLKEIANNKELQNGLEKNFDDTLLQYESIMGISLELYEKLKITPSTRIIEQYEEFNKNLAKSYKKQKSDVSLNQKLSDSRKKIYDWCKQEWNVYYESNSSEPINILNTIIEITPSREQTMQVINRILQGKKVIENKNNLAVYMSGIAGAKQLKDSLELEPYIIEFLSKVSAGEVTLLDLTESITEWIKKEELKNKFRIVF